MIDHTVSDVVLSWHCLSVDLVCCSLSIQLHPVRVGAVFKGGSCCSQIVRVPCVCE